MNRMFQPYNELEAFLSSLRQAVENYKRVPSNSRAFLTARDFEKLFQLLITVTENTKGAVERSDRSVKKADDTLDGMVANTTSIGFLTERIVALERQNKHFCERIAWAISRIEYLQSTPAAKRVIDKGEKEKEKYSLDEAPLSVRAFNCMKNEFGKDVSALTVSSQTHDELLRIPNLGRRSIKEIEENWLKPLGLKLAVR